MILSMARITSSSKEVVVTRHLEGDKQVMVDIDDLMQLQHGYSSSHRTPLAALARVLYVYFLTQRLPVGSSVIRTQ